jgi:hypothetical protein
MVALAEALSASDDKPKDGEAAAKGSSGWLSFLGKSKAKPKA